MLLVIIIFLTIIGDLSSHQYKSKMENNKSISIKVAIDGNFELCIAVESHSTEDVVLV